MKTSIRKYSVALASVLALGFMGCGTTGPNGVQTGGGPIVDPAPPPASPIAHPPVVNYGFFDPQTEEELKAYVDEGSLKGNPIVNYGYMIAKVSPRFDPAKFEKYGMEVQATITANGAKYYFLRKDSDLVETMKKVRVEVGGLMYIEPDIAHYSTAWDGKAVPFAWDKPDPLVASQQQYGVLVTDTMKAWREFGFGPNRAVVADVDTGVNFKHEDLTNTVRHAFTWYNPAGTALLSTVTTNPYRDDEPVDARLAPADYTYGTDFEVGDFHGTHTAGTIAAEGNNGKGVAGMCWNVDMVHYKCFFLNGTSSASYTWAVYGSLWHLAKWKKTNYPHTIPINYSLGSVAPSQFAADMVEMALENNIVICASSGNDYSGFPKWPCSYTGVIRVGATDYKDRRVAYSDWGRDMSVVAPGYDIYSTDGGDPEDYWLMSGTSMATPHVTGLVGYMLTFAPDLKPDQIRTLIEQNADPIDGQQGFSIFTGWGRINTYRTIAALKAGAPPSNYVLSPVKVYVENTIHDPMSSVTVYLYNCNQDGTITNYAGSTITGTSYVDVRDDLKLDAEEGVAIFNGLKPGWYKAVASPRVIDPGTGTAIQIAKSTPAFEIKRGGPASQKFTVTIDGFDALYVQTMPTSNAERQKTDTRVCIYNSATANALVDYDYDTFDTLIVKKPTKPGTYWIRVYPYSNQYYGEYALWLSSTGVKTGTAPGTAAAPGDGGEQGGLTDTRSATSQLIGIDDGKLYYADLTATNGHYYRFVVPEPAPAP